MASISKSISFSQSQKNSVTRRKPILTEWAFHIFNLMVAMSCVLDNLYTHNACSQAFTYFRMLRQCTLFSCYPYPLGWWQIFKTQLFPQSIWHKSPPDMKKEGQILWSAWEQLGSCQFNPWPCKHFFKERISLSMQAVKADTFGFFPR